MQKRIFIQFVLVIILPSALLFFFVNNYYFNYSLNQLIKSKRQTISEMQKNLDIKLNYCRQNTFQFYFNNNAMEEILNEKPIVECSFIKEELSRLVNTNRLISSAYLFTDKGFIYSGTGILGVEELHKKLQSSLKDTNGRIFWSPSSSYKSMYGMKQAYFWGSRHIRQNCKQIATLHIGIGEPFWDDFLSYTPIEQGQPLVVCDKNGTLISTNGSAPVGEQFYAPSIMSDIVNNRHPVSLVRDEKETIVLFSESDESGWFVTQIILPGKISSELQVIKNILYLFIIIYILFLILTHILSRNLSKPLKELSHALIKVGDGNWDVKVNEHNIDEISKLSQSFNLMTERIQTLMCAIKQKEREKRKAHIQTLQLQLAPHFLYNSLNTIRWMAQINGQNNIKTISVALISYLKEVADIKTEFQTIEKELKIMEDYAIIQRYRYKNFHLILDVPEEIRSYYINKMVLVNLLENSIVHGFYEMENEGIATIYMETQENCLYIRFSDNGVGFDAAHINMDINGSNGHLHTGLHSIKSRLNLYFNEEADIHVNSSPGEGCIVEITMPLIGEKDVLHEESM